MGTAEHGLALAQGPGGIPIDVKLRAVLTMGTLPRTGPAQEQVTRPATIEYLDTAGFVDAALVEAVLEFRVEELEALLLLQRQQRHLVRVPGQRHAQVQRLRARDVIRNSQVLATL
mmetsp:Transcript_20744/g.34264  ORF Transcript_20744/g.34264 Transcript_20744/m.34264 type:complete len:116 (+) Transcript_20744:1681-2028(+)